MVKFVRRKATSLALTAGFIIGLAFLAQRFGVGGRISGAAGSLGSTLTDIPSEFLKSFSLGAGGIGEQAVSISENFQRALSGGLLASEQRLFGGGGFAGGTANEQTLTTQPGATLPKFLENAFTAFGSNQTPTSQLSSKIGSSVFDVARGFTQRAQQARVRGFQPSTGFSDPQSQAQALQEEIAKSRASFAEFFKVG